MDIRPFYLFSYFVAIACLMAWLVRLGVAIYRWSQKSGLGRVLSGQKHSLRKLGQYLPWNEILLFIAGGVFGWSITSQIETWFVREWLLLTLTSLAILSNELCLSTKDVSLLAVMALIAGISEQRDVGMDVFERLSQVVDDLPPGDVQKAVREILQRRRSGLTVEQSFQPLRGMHPILTELIFTLDLTGGQALPAFEVALERLSLRAGRQWDRVSRTMISRKQIQPLLQFGQAAVLTALLYLVLGDMPAFTLAWPSYTLLGWVSLGCFFAVGVLYASHHHIWLRRFLGVGLLTASLFPLWQYASLPRLFELQFQPITHFKEGASGKRTVEIQEEWAPMDPPIFSAALENQLENITSFIQPTTAPALSTRAEEQPQSLSIPSQSQEEEKTWLLPCCLSR
jgi:hypothetical protein